MTPPCTHLLLAASRRPQPHLVDETCKARARRHFIGFVTSTSFIFYAPPRAAHRRSPGCHIPASIPQRRRPQPLQFHEDGRPDEHFARLLLRWSRFPALPCPTPPAPTWIAVEAAALAVLLPAHDQRAARGDAPALAAQHRPRLPAVVVELGEAVGGAPCHCDVVPASVGGGHAAEVVALAPLVLHHRHAP